MGKLLYHLTHQLTAFPPRFGSQVYRSGGEHVPKTGPALLLANHISHFDPGFLASGFPRYIHFMADKPLLEIPIYGWLLRHSFVFPIDRTKNDRAALKTTLARLEAGNIVCIFAEQGIRYRETSVLGGAEFPLGTASLWRMTNVPVIPMIIIGSDQMYDWRNLFRRPRRRIFVRVGPLLPPDRQASKEQLRDRIVAAWHEIFEGMKRDYDIRPDEMPHSAFERLGRPEPVRAQVGN